MYGFSVEADDWRKDVPFLLVAIVLHGLLLTENPILRWGTAARAPEKLIPVEFVTLPALAPSPELALSLPGSGDLKVKPGFGPGKFQRGKIAVPAPARAHARPRHKAAARPDPLPARRRLEHRMERRQKAIMLASAKAEVARVRAAERAGALQAARLAAEVKAGQARELARLLAERKALKVKRLADERAVRTRKTADISRELALLANPDEHLNDAVSDAPAAGAAPAAAAFHSRSAPGTDAAYEQGAGSRTGRDAYSSPAMGGGAGLGGGDVSFSLDGPIGSRRLLKRVLPQSPDWVSSRGLDLAVQIKFQVMPDGAVKAGAITLKTSGFPEIDRLALDAIRRWRFQAAPAGAAKTPVWGSVKFRFTMS